MKFETINPENQEVIKEYTYLTREELHEKLNDSKHAYKYWKDETLEARKFLINNVKELLLTKKLDYANVITEEMGKPISQSIAEVEKCASLCDYYINIVEESLNHREIESEFQKSYVRYDSMGAIFGIMPWNFPFWQVFRYAIPNILVGNVVLLKHAQITTGCSLKMQELFEEAELPHGVFQALVLDKRDTEEVIKNPIVAGVTLTGSEPAGRNVASLAGKYLKKSVMELGGSDPFIVCKDADIVKAAKNAVFSRLINTGQTCISAKRFIVEKEVAEKFISAAIMEIEMIKSGSLLDKDTQIGFMAREDLANTLEKQLEDLEKSGGEILVGGDRDGNFFSPSLVKVDKENTYANYEELFGPIGVVTVVDSEEELIEIANNTPFGLGAAVWSENIEKAEEIAAKIEAGCVAINDFVKSDPRFPFGGVKNSGYGRELSSNALHEFVNIKTVYVK
ncbi:NAD-dependent succinate-semialdehyde dehydrogenase [Aureivirga sp. CE67]|uniref:NAD-dependent succinate-semialdehyde dehydrogenase n=1 Tax=Aureivirga sp. CE67 TaxID=1788983 RepID=UPI0018C96969|nr:NAD-dependent succinate-semialdehyde dehydrogenase [Aureivirga sp. CE67]